MKRQLVAKLGYSRGTVYAYPLARGGVAYYHVFQQGGCQREVRLNATTQTSAVQEALSGVRSRPRAIAPPGRPSRPSRYVNQDGYAQVLVGDTYELEHRLVMAEMIGRELYYGETIHHVNGDRADNRPENLWLWPNEGCHSAYHQMVRRGHDLRRAMHAVPLE